MRTGSKIIRRLLGVTLTVVFVAGPAVGLFVTSDTITRFSLGERLEQVRAVTSARVGLGFSASESMQHLGASILWTVAALLWIVGVVIPMARAARNIRSGTAKPAKPGNAQLKAATWVLSLALFGVAGQVSASDTVELRPEPITLEENELRGGEDVQVVMIRKGQSLRNVLSNWLTDNHPRLARDASDADIDQWTRTVLSQNPSDNWTSDSYLENVSAMMVQVTVPSVGAPPLSVQQNASLTSVINDLLPEDVDWDASGDVHAEETQFGDSDDAGLEASSEAASEAAAAAETKYDPAPAGAPTIDSWENNTAPSAEQPGGSLVKLAALGALGVVGSITAGRLLCNMQIWRASASGQEHVPDVTMSEDETDAVATLASLASNDPTELRAVAARTVAASSHRNGIPSMSALMINCDTGAMMALLLRGDKAEPVENTPWERPSDDYMWVSSIEQHRRYPQMLEQLDTQLDPYPCLVCLGDLPNNSGSLWIDLEVFNNVRIGVRNKPGVPVEQAARLGLSTMWSWALELLTGPTSSAEVIVCGFGKDLQMMGARYFESLNEEAVEYISRRVNDQNDNSLDGLLEGRPASQLRMVTGNAASLSPMVVFVPFPPGAKEAVHSDTLWEMANFFDRRTVTCVFGYAPDAARNDPTTHFPLVTIEPDPDGASGAHTASMNNPPLRGLHRRNLDPGTQKQVQRVLKRHYKAVTEPPKKTGQKKRDRLADVAVPSEKVVATVSAGTEPDYFHLRLFGEPLLFRNNVPWPRLLPGDLEMVSFLAAARGPVSLEELSRVAGHNASFADRRYAQTRNRLGHDPDGKLFLAPRAYAIQTDRFTCDLHQFEDTYHMLTHEQAITDPEKRAEAAKSALGLVTGRPFGNAASKWPWAEGFPDATWNLVVKIDHLVHSYAQAAAAANNWHEVLWATSRRLMVHPSPCTTCYELAADAAERSGHTDAAQQIRHQLHQKKTMQDYYLPEAVAGV